MELNEATVNATSAEIRINVAVLLAATSLSIPALSQTGIRISAPPIARVAPTNPAQKPAIRKYHTLSSFTYILFAGVLPLFVIEFTLRLILISFSYFILSLI